MKRKDNIQEALPLLAPLAPYVLPAAATALGAAGMIMQARKQGQGARSQPVDYGQSGEGSTPRTPATVRPAAPKADYKTLQRQRQREEAESRRREREEDSQRKIDQLIGTDAERKAAAQARANQPQIQQQLRRQSQRDRMNRAAENIPPQHRAESYRPRKTFQMFMEQAMNVVPLSPYKTIPADPKKPLGTKTLVDPITGMKPSGQPYPYQGASIKKQPLSTTTA